MDKLFKLVNLYVASLKAIVHIHQHNHWTTKGDSFYADHLLFSKVYESAQEDLDLAAEKFIGLFSSSSVDFDMQNDLLNKILKKYSTIIQNNLDSNGDVSAEGHVKLSLSIEKDFLKMSESAYAFFEKEGKLSLGLDDMLASIASSREEAIYLLNQRLNDMS